MIRRFGGAVPFFSGVIITFFILSQLAFKNNNITQTKRTTITTWEAPALPDEMLFAGEKVPLERWDVKERLEREMLYTYYGQANIIFLLKMSHRYFPVISEQLKAAGVPDDFKYLCVAESNLVTTAQSRVGAVSFWQFMGYTGPGYNLVINDEVDERFNLKKSTDAACKYIKQAYAKFGSWTAAAASYNCGQGGYNNQAAFQQTYNYYDLQLPEETNKYLFRILTFKQLLEKPEKYGYAIKDEEKYSEVPYRTMVVTASIPSLVQFALDNKTTYKMLRLMNPWIRGKLLTIKPGTSYTLKLPQ